ncbi:hypothetical protein HO173_003527 [Letharia columbiana]|uniref:Uncharacterized protein n=1 Tax=Letharia columbiana TaxID=112416 RepID=A0A8H6G0T2_9LECA|nr:uncharacterized protein HO173_003527 [Letharia columbiana]KAF6238247.1 hypothetical protein HO173_003527 [Letharia columbiana]
MDFAISYLVLLFANIGAAVYIHIEDGHCIDLYDPKNMVGGFPAAIPICGISLASACGTSDDGAPEALNPYDCKDCDTVTIFDGFKYSKQMATGEPTCKGVFPFPEDYGDVYYNSDGYLYDAFGNQIGDASCDEAVDWGGQFQNPWNSKGDGTHQPSTTPCPTSASPPAPSASCYHGADPDACPDQYDPGWCYCNNEAPLYPIMAGNDPCGYTVMPTITTTSPTCTAT